MTMKLKAQAWNVQAKDQVQRLIRRGCPPVSPQGRRVHLPWVPGQRARQAEAIIRMRTDGVCRDPGGWLASVVDLLGGKALRQIVRVLAGLEDPLN